MERILVLLLLRCIITFTNIPLVEPQAIGTDCNGKRFICLDSNRFQVCVDVPGGQTETTDELTHVCAPDTFCYNDGMVECDSTAPFDELASLPEVLSETGDTLTTSNNVEDSEKSNLGGVSTTSGISYLNTLTVSSLSSSDATQLGTEGNPSEGSNLTDTTDMTEMPSTDFSALSNSLPESPMSTLLPEYTEMRLDAAATDETPATFENSTNEDLETGDRASTSNTVDETSSTLSAAIPSLESESSTVTQMTSESSFAEQSPESTTVIQPTTTEKRFFCELPGSYPHESNCHKYYICVQRPYGFIRFELSCYLNMAFDPILHRCVFSQRTCHPTRDAFVCPSDGKFPDPSGGGGGQYYWCVGNGTDYLMYQMRCPYGQRFNADAGQCQDGSGPDVVITSGGMQTVVVDDSGDSSSESSDSDDYNE